ncbi:hypothetical protein FISHEDRAFT_56140 [Fistulina hepatica ATCC 64428]|uniref:Protein CPL1-like domain-containing protein n=1 Tax=Fistulina hepatica ATCC 64428 TaxID=1128425 RepID=A0A0D7AMZ4_9AGAR|nr:hypothetical protein FISHEDRAFT_56140 [Fistulina hepatica ATCC 64428]
MQDRALIDVCANLDADLVVHALAPLLDVKNLDLQLCLCIKDLDIFLETHLFSLITSNLLGPIKAVLSLLDKVVRLLCHILVVSANLLTLVELSVTKVIHCKMGVAALRLGGGCITPGPFADVSRAPQLVGEDCTQRANVRAASCVNAQCMVIRCASGFKPNQDRTACVVDGTSLRIKRDIRLYAQADAQLLATVQLALKLLLQFDEESAQLVSSGPTAVSVDAQKLIAEVIAVVSNLLKFAPIVANGTAPTLEGINQDELLVDLVATLSLVAQLNAEMTGCRCDIAITVQALLDALNEIVSLGSLQATVAPPLPVAPTAPFASTASVDASTSAAVAVPNAASAQLPLASLELFTEFVVDGTGPIAAHATAAVDADVSILDNLGSVVDTDADGHATADVPALLTADTDVTSAADVDADALADAHVNSDMATNTNLRNLAKRTRVHMQRRR